MEHYNQQILAYWDGSELTAGNRETKANMVEAMAAAFLSQSANFCNDKENHDHSKIPKHN